MQTSDLSATASISMPFLQSGDSGEAVRFLQQLLINYGYLSSASFDSKFNPATKKAVEYFQGGYGLMVDGKVGAKTWRALAEASVRC